MRSLYTCTVILTLNLIGVMGWAATAPDSSIKPLPSQIELNQANATQRLILEQFEGDSAVADLSSQVIWTSHDSDIADVDDQGVVHAVADGKTTIVAVYNGEMYEIPVFVDGCTEYFDVSFTNDIQPILTKLGCNTGACHGAEAGKNGFNLSLRGYDHPSDYDAITRHANGRRVLVDEPEQSLVLQKPTMQIPHAGGKRMEVDSLEYEILKSWIGQKVPAPRKDELAVESLQVYPNKMKLTHEATQQLLVHAIYSDGSKRDVTRWVKFDTTDDSVAVVDESGLAEVKGSGSAALTVWYASKVSFARVNVPFVEPIDEAVFVSASNHNFIDDAILNQLQALNIAPSEDCTDLEFIRRAYLDCIGVLPSKDEITRFMLDSRENKRAELIERLLNRTEYVDYWTYKWSDLLLVNSRHLSQEALWSYYRFIRDSVENNKGWDEFTRDIITAEGSNIENGAANFYAIHKETTQITETTSQAFLGMSVTCARCHNHPMEKWTQEDYYGMANLFARVKLKNGNRGGEVYVQSSNFGEVLHPLYNEPMTPKPLDGEALTDPNKNRREHLADWLTAKDNPYFARAIINRVWANFMGMGIVNEVDDLRLTNPPSNEELFDRLEADFVENGYDIKRLIRLIMNSAAYQRSSQPRLGNEADETHFSRYMVKRLPAEVLLDAYSQVTEVPTEFSGYPKGWRAMQLPDSSVNSYFLKTFGRPIRNQTCECERQSTPTLTQSLHISNGETLNEKLSQENSLVDQYLDSGESLKDVMFDVYLRSLSRTPKDQEIQDVLTIAGDEAAFQAMKKAEKRLLIEDLVWAVLSSKEFVFNH